LNELSDDNVEDKDDTSMVWEDSKIAVGGGELVGEGVNPSGSDVIHLLITD
jgi:hypothetical protein